MKTLLILLSAFLFTAETFGGESKKFEKTFQVPANKKIEFNGTSSMDVEIKSWNKNEIQIELIVEVSCSDKEVEKEYIGAFNIESWETSTDFIIKLNEPDFENHWSIWDIFKFRFHYYYETSKKGVIYIPETNNADMNIRYSQILLQNTKGEINLIGRGNEIRANDARNMGRIDNAYGNIYLKDCSGTLDLDTRGSELEIDGFEGRAKIKGLYSNMKINDVSEFLDVTTRSSEISIRNTGSDLKLEADYSNVVLENINGTVEMKHRGAELKAKNLGGLNFDGPYTNISIDGIRESSDNLVKIVNRSGSISLSDCQNDVRIIDSYSEIDLNNITGNIYLESRSNTISAKKIVGNWMSSSSYCDLTLKEIEADSISIVNKSNPVTVFSLNNPDFVGINNEYGAVTLDLPDNYEGEISLYATYGEIETEIPLKVKTQGSSSNAFGRVGTAERTLSIESRSANILLKTHPSQYSSKM